MLWRIVKYGYCRQFIKTRTFLTFEVFVRFGISWEVKVYKIWIFSIVFILKSFDYVVQKIPISQKFKLF